MIKRAAMRFAVLLVLICCAAGITAVGCKSTVDGLESDIRTVLSKIEMDRLKDKPAEQKTRKQISEPAPAYGDDAITESTPDAVEPQPVEEAPSPPREENYRLTVAPDPPDSRVSLVNFDESYSPGIGLTPGYYEVLVQRSGYEPFREWVQMNEDKILTVALTKRSGAIAEKKPASPAPKPETVETAADTAPILAGPVTGAIVPSLPDTLSGHQELVTSLAFSPDGRMLASASYDNTVILWKMPEGLPVKTLTHNDRIRAVAFSPNGRTLAAGGNDRNLYLWNVETGNRIDTLRGLSGRINCIEFSPDGLSAAAGGLNEVMIWRIDSGRIEAHMVGDDEFYPRFGSVNAIAFHPNGGDRDGFSLAFTCQAGIAIYNVVTKEAIILSDTAMPNSVTYSPDGRYIAWGARHQHGELLFFPRFVLVETKEPDKAISISDSSASADRVFFTGYVPGGRQLVLLSYRQAVLYDIKAGAVIRTFPDLSGTAVTDAAVNPDGSVLAATAGNLIRLFPLSDPALR
jgi:WD40 repeat protein